MGEVYSFSGGDKLTKYLEDLAKKVSKGGELRVGFLEGGTYPDGTSTPMVAAIQEFGAPEAKYPIPARPFMKPTVNKHSDEWGEVVGDELVRNEYDGYLTLKSMGELIADEIREEITLVMSPPLSPSTIKSKGFDKPLVDTKNMIDTVGWEVKTQ